MADGATRHLRDAWPAAAVALIALVFVPGASSAFELPKLVGLGAFAVAALVSGFRTRTPARSLVGVTLFAAALTATLFSDVAKPAAVVRELSVGLVVVGLTLRRVRVESLAGPLALAGSAIAALTLAQSLGVGQLGADAPGRLALFGTLGNPDFVAAFLAPVLAVLVPWLGVRRVGRWALVAFVLVAGALAATRSLATLLALGAAAVVFAYGWWQRRMGCTPEDASAPAPVQPERSRGPTGILTSYWPSTSLRTGGVEGYRIQIPMFGALRRRSARTVGLPFLLLGALLLCAALALGRDWRRALDGRAYLWRVAAPHALVHPLTGFGPGSVEALWPEWETAAWRAGAFAPSQARFVDAQNHLHQDVLERAVEQGALGVLALLMTAGLALFRLVRARTPQALAAAAALAALLARALVDFPLARPAEAALFALLLAAGLSSSHPLKEST